MLQSVALNLNIDETLLVETTFPIILLVATTFSIILLVSLPWASGC